MDGAGLRDGYTAIYLSPNFFIRLQSVEGGSQRISDAPPLPATIPFIWRSASRMIISASQRSHKHAVKLW